MTLNRWIISSVGGSDLLVGLALPGVDAGHDGGDAGESVLGLLDLGDGDVGGVDGQLVGSAVGLVLGQLVDVDHPLLTVHLDHLPLAALPSTTDNDDLIVLADGEGTDAPLLAQVLREGGGHDSLPDVGGCGEVGSSLLSARAGDFDVGLHLWLELINKYIRAKSDERVPGVIGGRVESRVEERVVERTGVEGVERVPRVGQRVVGVPVVGPPSQRLVRSQPDELGLQLHLPTPAQSVGGQFQLDLPHPLVELFLSLLLLFSLLLPRLALCLLLRRLLLLLRLVLRFLVKAFNLLPALLAGVPDLLQLLLQPAGAF
jgi:hypothetical protein